MCPIISTVISRKTLELDAKNTHPNNKSKPFFTSKAVVVLYLYFKFFILYKVPYSKVYYFTAGGLLQKAILKESLGMNTNACGHRKLQDAKLTSAPDANYNKTG